MTRDTRILAGHRAALAKFSRNLRVSHEQRRPNRDAVLFRQSRFVLDIKTYK